MRGDLKELRDEMSRLGFTQAQQDTLETDVAKAHAAIVKAIDIGASSPSAYALKLFRSPTFAAPPSPPKSNRYALPDPKYSDDGERIWQHYEVDGQWRRGYLDDCLKALEEGREPAARYAPSDDELNRFHEVTGKLDTSPQNLVATPKAALTAWGEMWFGKQVAA